MRIGHWILIVGMAGGGPAWSAPGLGGVEDPGGWKGAAPDGIRDIVVGFIESAPRVRQSEFLPSVTASIRYLAAPGGAGVVARAGHGGGRSIFSRLAVIHLRPHVSLAAGLERLNRHPAVLFAEPDFPLSVAELRPNDFRYGEQWHLEDREAGGDEARFDIGAPRAWSESTGSPAVRVAIIDTGIDYFHPDLEANIWVNEGEIPGNGLDDDANGYVDDIHGYDFVSDDGDPMDDHHHGTHVAGIVGAVGNNEIGVTGVCWQVQLMALKSFDENGDSRVSDSIVAIQYAIANGATVLNASWGGSDPSQALEMALSEAWNAGLVIVAAAGNNRSDDLYYPAALDGVIAVAALTREGRRARFSNYGDFVDVSAPGDRIMSTLPESSYSPLSGTSMAAPQVAGLAALLLGHYPDYGVREVTDIIANTTRPLEDDTLLQSGLIDAGRAMRIDQALPTLALDVPDVIYGRVDIRGTVVGESLAEYTVWHGKGTHPEEWIPILSDSKPVEQGGILVPEFSTGGLDDGALSIRLTATNQGGHTAEQRTVTHVRNTWITSPENNDILRAGTEIEIRGTVFGDLTQYRLEYGIGYQPTAWFKDGIELIDGGLRPRVDEVLGRWETAGLEPGRFYSVRLTGYFQDGRTAQHEVVLIYLDPTLRPGWPQYLPIGGNGLASEDWRSLQTADLDADGMKELLVVDSAAADTQGARLRVFHLDGSPAWSAPIGKEETCPDIPLIGDFMGDSTPEVFVAAAGDPPSLWIYDARGNLIADPWPLPGCPATKMLADVVAGGAEELIVLAPVDGQGAGEGDAVTEGRPYSLRVYAGSGEILREWNFPETVRPEGALPPLAAAVNLDDDPQLELVAAVGRRMRAFDGEHPDEAIWEVIAEEGEFVASPVVGDLNDDGAPEIVIGAWGPEMLSGGALYAVDARGRSLAGWPVLPGESFETEPALGDIDGDGDLEIVVAGNRTRKLHVIHHHGFAAKGWPVDAPASVLRTSLGLADIDGDGAIDIVGAIPGLLLQVVRNGVLEQSGGLRAWNASGNVIDINPHPRLVSLPVEASGGYVSLRSSPPLLDDLDGNGLMDAVIVSIQDAAYSPDITQPSRRKQRSSIYVRELSVPWAPSTAPWPRLRHDVLHQARLVRVIPPDTPPEILAIPNQLVPAGTEFFPVELDRFVEDAESPPDAMQWEVSATGGVEVQLESGRIVRVTPPGRDWVGTATVRFRVTDPAGNTATAEATFAAAEDRRPPDLLDDFLETGEDQEVEVNGLVNDRDPAGNDLELVYVETPLHGKVRWNRNGMVTYIPESDFFGDDFFGYFARSSNGVIGVAQIHVVVRPENDAPRPAVDRIIIDEDEGVTIDVLANDVEVEGEALSLIDWEPAERGEVAAVSNRSLRYTPEPDVSGLDRFEYTVEDPHGARARGLVEVLIKPVNDPPRVEDFAVEMNRNTTKSIGFRSNDPDGDDLEFTVVQGPAHGIVLAFPRVAEYEPERGFSGEDRITYTASDGRFTTREATISITVLARNNPPQAEAQSLFTLVDQSLPIQLHAEDRDEDPLEYEILSFPEHGRLSGEGTNWIYRPDAGFMGEDALRFRAWDGKDFSAPTRIGVTVTDENTAPVARALSFTVLMNETTSLTLVAEDKESTSLQFSITALPDHGRLKGTSPTYLYTPETDYLGPDRFLFLAHDGELVSEPAEVYLTVKHPNHPPEAMDRGLRLAAGQPSEFLLPVTDPDGDDLRTAILKGPQHGRLSGIGVNYFYVPDPGFTGSDRFTFKAWDGRDYSNVAEIKLFIGESDEPIRVELGGLRLASRDRIAFTIRSNRAVEVEIQGSADLAEWEFLTSVVVEADPHEMEVTLPVDSPVFFLRAVAAGEGKSSPRTGDPAY